MKKPLFSILFLPFLFLTRQQVPHKIALVIAVGNYAPQTGWKNISSARDIPYVRATLMAQGFAAGDIDTLENEQATRAGIMKAIDRLINRAAPGDIVVFHFSGHGQQIFDDGKKDEADGYDEALVPYDAPMRYGNGYTGENHLRDDDLGDKLKLLRARIGSAGSLLVLLDACHSGTATRGQDIALARGTDIRCEPPGYQAGTVSRGAPAGEGIFDDSELLSNMVVISAAGADQLNYETRDDTQQGVGSLSYAFSLAMNQLGRHADYHMLFEKIKTLIQSWKPFQNPQIEGNLNQEVLGGTYLPPADLLPVESWKDQTVTMARGTLQRILPGAGFRVYPVNVTDYSTAPVCTGIIEQAGLLKATGRVSSTRPSEKEAYKVVFESQNMGDIRVAVKLDVTEPALAGQLKSGLEDLPFIALNGQNADVAISSVTSGGSRQLQVWCSNDSIIWQKSWQSGSTLKEEETKAIAETIRRYARAQFLRALGSEEAGNAFPYVSVEFVPGQVITVNGTDSLTERQTIADFTNPQGNLQFQEADNSQSRNNGFVIRLRNLHDFPVYFSVLDIQPDNEVNVTVPDPADPYSTAEDFKVMPRQTFETRPIKLYPPYGREFMKVLISRQAMDLKGIQTRSASRGSGTTFESFYNDSFQDAATSGSRGTQMTPVKVDEVRIVPFSFLIVSGKKP